MVTNNTNKRASSANTETVIEMCKAMSLTLYRFSLPKQSQKNLDLSCKTDQVFLVFWKGGYKTELDFECVLEGKYSVL